MSPYTRRKPCVYRRLPRYITRPHFLNHISCQYIIDITFIQCRFSNEALEGQALEVDGQLVFVDGRAHGEGKSDAIDDDYILGGVGGLTSGGKM